MYRIIGADGKEYGPITIEQMRQWIAEGRLNALSKVRLEGSTEWKTLSDFPELAAAPSTPPIGSTPPPTFAPGAPGTSPLALEQVNGPAIGLIVTGALTLVFALGRTAMSVFGVGMNALNSSSNANMPNWVATMSGGMGIVLGILSILCGAIILYGGLKMKRLENYGLCMGASILAMIPCLACCLVGLPVGIWALVILAKPEVKSAFH
jgi:hypothetical protein